MLALAVAVVLCLAKSSPPPPSPRLDLDSGRANVSGMVVPAVQWKTMWKTDDGEPATGRCAPRPPPRSLVVGETVICCTPFSI